MKSPRFRAVFVVPRSGAKELGDIIRTDHELWGKVVRANNITMASDTCPSGSWSNYFLGPQVSPGNIGDLMDIAIEARRTSGSGSIRLVPSYVRGEQS